MQHIFTSHEPFEPERIHAIAVYCSDGRYGNQVDEFLRHYLALPNYDRLTVPGGPAWLCYQRSVTLVHHDIVREQLDFLVEAHGLRRAVLIAHYGCAYYARHHGGDAESILSAQIQDLHAGARLLHHWYPPLRVETYLARAHDGRVQFEEISL